MSTSERNPPRAVSIRRLLIWCLGLIAAGIGVLIATGFLGGLHPVFDSLSVFRGILTVCALICALGLWALGGVRVALLTAVLPLLGGISLAPHWLGNTSVDGGLTLYQKNLWYRNPVTSGVLDDIRAVAPDFVTLQEVARRNETILDDLRDEFPTQLRCPFYRFVGDVAVLSRWPVVPGSEICEEHRGLGAMTVETPQGPVTVVAIHFHWPWPHAQPYQARDLEPALSSLTGPIIIAGDFNMVRWSATMRRLAEVSGTTPLGASQISYTRKPWMPLGLSIDSVYTSGGTGSTETRPLFRSDHKGIVAQIAWPE